jgi:hypothetical protein
VDTEGTLIQTFEWTKAETYQGFLDLVTGLKLVYSYVDDLPTTSECHFEIDEPMPGERYLAFNLAEHGEEARKRFREVSFIEQRLGLPAIRPIPYWSAFVVGMGPYDTRYSLAELNELIKMARKEAEMLQRAFKKK